MKEEEASLACYATKSKERLMAICSNERALKMEPGVTESPSTIRKNKIAEREGNWESKALHGQILRQTEDIRNSLSWEWLRKGDIKKETEGMILAAQEQALRTNAIKANIDKQNVSALCRMCHQKEESVNHVICECSKLAQSDYKIRHDNVARIIHWELSKVYGLTHAEKWYDHVPEAVIESNEVKLLWDFNIQTDKVIEHRRPDIVVVDYKQKHCHIIDIAVPGDSRVEEKEKEKVEKYQQIKREITRLWNMRATVDYGSHCRV